MRSRGRRVAPRPRRFKPGSWTRETLTAAIACITVVAAVVAVVWHSHMDRASSLALAPGAASASTSVTAHASKGPTRAAASTKHARALALKKRSLERRRALARIVERKIRLAAEPATSTMRVASLNILGSNHVGRGLARAAGESSLLENRGVDIVGLQEVQRDQRRVFLRQMPAYAMWPQDAAGRQGYRLQILFRTARFEMVGSGAVNAPFVGMSVPMPYVLLRDRSNGVEFWVVDAHLSPEGRQGERNVGTAIQERLVDQLNDTHPVLMVGDMNEHSSWFCRLAARVSVMSANGGSSAGCGPSGPVRIDWIVGSDAAASTVAFSGYAQDGTTKQRRLSDHYLVYATASVTAKPSKPSTSSAR